MPEFLERGALVDTSGFVSQDPGVAEKSAGREAWSTSARDGV